MIMMKHILTLWVTIVMIPIFLFANNTTIEKDRNMNKEKKTVSLVLGSGGARGYAHIGVIETLEAKGYKIQSISGSSMGALIGAIYAAGKLKAYKEWVLSLDFIDTLKLLDLSLSSGSIVNIDSVYQKIEALIGDVNIEDLPIRYRAVASDIKNQKKVWFKQGKLIDAIRSSIAIPTIFTPVIKDDMILVDGGVLDPLPVASIASDPTDLKIAVNLNANIPNTYEVKKSQEAPETLYENTIEFAQQVKEAITEAPTSSEEHSIDIFYILSKSLDATQNIIVDHTIEKYQPDIIIDIPRNACESYAFDKAYEMIEIGKMASKKSLKIYASQLDDTN
jgi:NTE family protein